MENLHPSNVFVSNAKNGDVLITDVGLSHLKGLQQSQLSVHTEFTAPEVLLRWEQGANFLVSTPEAESPDVGSFTAMNDPESADIWSLGMLTKYLATGNTNPNLKPLTLKGTPYSSELVDFLFRCLQEVPSRRCKASILLKHVFITKRKFKIHDLDGSFQYKPDNEV